MTKKTSSPIITPDTLHKRAAAVNEERKRKEEEEKKHREAKLRAERKNELARRKASAEEYIREQIVKAADDGKYEYTYVLGEDMGSELYEHLSQVFHIYNPVKVSIKQTEIVNYEAGEYNDYYVPAIKLSW